MDEQAHVLSRAPTPARLNERVRAGALGTLLSAALAWPVLLAHTSCLSTEVALISVRNETATSVHVRARLRGFDNYEDTFDLAPAEERALVKYEEGRAHVDPVGKRVDGIEVVTSAGCVARVDDGALEKASTRESGARRWTVHVLPDAVAAARCPAASPAGAVPSARPGERAP